MFGHRERMAVDRKTDG
jgi:hypothetical protein